ncbi:Anti-sigma F factor [Paraconexibacter sp. AEG42_29]|uniref:Anti-sigma F factor n=1 Tax=Paraconexibacter sp. AEG42_29 TaxID=2997339 RepID=A0AAU7ATK3_9ACTN
MGADALLRQAFAAFNERDAEAFVATMHPDIVFVPLLTATRAEPYRGREGMRTYLEDAYRWAAGEVVVNQVQDLGDVAVLHARIDVANDTGRVSLDAVYVARLRDGLIADLATLADLSPARHSLGIDPSRSIADLVLDLEAVPANVRVARRAAGAFAATVGYPDVPAVELAITEAVTNVVLHAYIEEPAAGTLRLMGRLDDGDVVFTIEDDGRGLLPRPDSPGLGMGLALMQTQAAEIAFVGPPQRARGCEVRLRFSRAA